MAVSPDQMNRSIKTNEALAGALVRGEKGGRTPEEKASKQIAAKAKEQSPQQYGDITLRSLQQVDSGQIHGTIDAAISSDRKPTGEKVRSKDQRDRMERATKRAEVVNVLISEGYDKIPDFDPRAPMDKVKVRSEIMEAAQSAWPDVFSQISSLPPADQVKLIDAWAKNPKYAEKLKGLLLQVSNPGNRPPEIPQEIREALGKAEQEYTTKSREITAREKERDDARASLKEFEMKGKVTGVKKVELDAIQSHVDLDADIGAAEASLRMVTPQIKTAEMNLESARRMKDPGEISRWTSELTKLHTDQLTAERERDYKKSLKQKRTELEAEKVGAQAEIRQFDKDLVTLRDELNDLDAKRSLARGTMYDSQSATKRWEDDFMREYDEIFKKGFNEFMQDELNVMKQAQEALINEAIASASDSADKGVDVALRDRWNRSDGRIDGDLVTEDYDTLLELGPDKILDNILMRELNKGNITPEQYKEKMRDKDWVSSQGAKVAERLLTRRIQTGRITRDEARLIRDSSWGPGMIDRAINSKKEYKSELASLRASGVLKGSVMDRIREISDGNLLKFLLMILSGVTVAPLALIGLSRALKDDLK